MDDALVVDRFEAERDLPCDVDRAFQRQRRAVRGRVGDRLLERRPFDELEHERPRAVGILDSVDRADVGVAHRRQDARLTLEASDVLGIAGEELRQELQRDIAIEAEIARAIDLPHAARAEQARDLIGPDARARR